MNGEASNIGHQYYGTSKIQAPAIIISKKSTFNKGVTQKAGKRRADQLNARLFKETTWE